MNLVVTCQDAGASEHLVPLLSFLKDSFQEIVCLVLAKNPALKIFQQQGINAVEILDLEAILNHVNNFQPHFILVSLSSTYDIDCRALEIAKQKNVPSGCIQDFWGSIGFFAKDNLPNYLFVENTYAKGLTRKNVDDSCKIIKVGLTKIIDLEPSIEIVSNKKIIAVIGQPSGIPGVAETTSEIFKILDELLDNNFDIFYKPHPADIESLDEKALKIAHDSKIIIFDGRLNDLFVSAVLVVNIFSTVLIDFLRYRQASSCNGNIISCIWNNELRDYLAGSDLMVAKLADQFFEDKASFQNFVSNPRNMIELSYNQDRSDDVQNNLDPFRSIAKKILESKT